jgi:hypothetical protein
LIPAKNSGSVSTNLASTWFPKGKIFPIPTCWKTGSMGWPRWLGLTLCHLIHPPSQFLETYKNFQSEIFKVIKASCRIQPINVSGFLLSRYSCNLGKPQLDSTSFSKFRNLKLTTRNYFPIGFGTLILSKSNIIFYFRKNASFFSVDRGFS